MVHFPDGSEVKASASNVGDPGSIPGSGRSPGEGNGTPLQYSCLENPKDRGAWQATAYGVAKSQTQPKQHSTQSWYCKDSFRLHTMFPISSSFFHCVLQRHTLWGNKGNASGCQSEMATVNRGSYGSFPCTDLSVKKVFLTRGCFASPVLS